MSSKLSQLAFMNIFTIMDLKIIMTKGLINNLQMVHDIIELLGLSLVSMHLFFHVYIL